MRILDQLLKISEVSLSFEAEEPRFIKQKSKITIGCQEDFAPFFKNTRTKNRNVVWIAFKYDPSTFLLILCGLMGHGE